MSGELPTKTRRHATLDAPPDSRCAVTTILDWGRTALAEQPVFWAGIAVWSVGLVLSLRGMLGAGDDRLMRAGGALCWIGLVLAALPLVGLTGRAPAPPWPELGAGTTAYNGIWLLWLLGGLMIVGGWLRVLGPRAGWLGLCLAMTGVVAASAERAAAQRLVMACGVLLVVLLALVSLRRGQLGRHTASPGDYEAELVSLCGNPRKAEQLIRKEQERSPTLSRAGAAMAVVTRLRVDRQGLGRPL
jgi:hypothetical protein